MQKFLLLCSMVFLLSACTQKPEIADREEVIPRGVSIENSHLNVQENQYSDTERADYLANLAASIPDVDNATVVVIGNMAVVGIDIKGDIERSKVGSIKYSVTESLRHDPQGAGAIVIADPDLTSRLKEVREDTQQGKPLRGIMNELADIVGRVMPDVPIPEKQHTPQDAVDKNESDQGNVEHIKKEQSNDKNQ